jgi:hypothetical protein
MVFVAVSIPKLARSDSSMYQAHLEVGRIFFLACKPVWQLQEYYLLPPPLFGGDGTCTAKDPELDPLVRGTDLRIRIRTKMSRNTG